MPLIDSFIKVFKSTPPGASTSRNELMVEDVRKFAQEIKAFNKEWTELSKETGARLNLVSGILEKPLPRVYANGHNGATPAQETRRIGLNVASAGIEKARLELEHRLRDDVMLQLDKWIGDYRATKAAHREAVELLRQANAQRQTATALNDKYQKQNQAGHKDKETTKSKATFEQGKADDLQQRYVQREQEVYDQLVQLIQRSALFKDGIAMSFRIFQGAFSTGYQAFVDGDAGIAPATSLLTHGSMQAHGAMATYGSMQAHGAAAAYHVNEPEENRYLGHPGSVPSLPAPTDHVNGVPTPDYNRTQAGQDENPFARGGGSGGGAAEYAPRPVDPYAQPAHYGAPSPVYGAPAAAVPYGTPAAAVPYGQRAPDYSSGGGAPEYPSMYGGPARPAAPSAQEQGSTPWVDNGRLPATKPNAVD